MSRAAFLAKLAFLGLSLALHGALAALFFAEAPVEIEGATGGAVQARQGSSFADFVAGGAVMAPQSAPTAAVPVQSARPIPAQQAESVATRKPESLRAEPAPGAPTRPVTASATALSPLPPEALQAPRPEPLEAIPERAVIASLRPPERPTRPPRAAAKKPQPRAAQPGNAPETARAGAAEGAPQARATRQASGAGQSSAAGRAAASNYQGEVLQRISRSRKPRVAARGAALVRFSIAGNGGLGGLSIARSSGSARLDSAALQTIRRAAPFPPPPPGARTSFTIAIKGG